jgi:hypothetical protein
MPDSRNRPNWIEPIAYAEISVAVLWLIILTSIVMSTGIESSSDEFFVILAYLISITFLFVAVIGGIGLLKRKKIGRTISIIIAALMSIVPISWFIGIPMLIYLLRSKVREYFELSIEQESQINSQQNESKEETFESDTGICPYCKSTNVDEGWSYSWQRRCLDCKKEWNIKLK